MTDIQPDDSLASVPLSFRGTDGSYAVGEIAAISASGVITYRKRPITELTEGELRVAVADILQAWALSGGLYAPRPSP